MVDAVCAYPDVIKYASKNTEHAHQVALFMWLRHAVWDWSEKNPHANELRCYFLHSETSTYTAFERYDLERTNECLFAIPNGGMRDKITAARLKNEGVKSGVSDLMLPIAVWSGSSMNCTETCIHGLFIEMKRPKSDEKGRKGIASPAQEAWADICHRNGYRWVLAETWISALSQIHDYMSGRTSNGESVQNSG